MASRDRGADASWVRPLDDVAARLTARCGGGRSLKRGAVNAGMDQDEHPAKLKRLGRHKSFDVLCEYLEFDNLFEEHPVRDVL